MIKHLFIVRHATAEDTGNSAILKDFDRELISKGIMESAKVGKYLSTYFPNIDAIYSSPATRAYQTAKYIAEQIKFEIGNIQTNEDLYFSGPKGYLAVLSQIPAHIKTAMIVGHNPDISYFADYLTRDDNGGSMKKASVIHLTFEGFEWAELSQNLGTHVKRIDGKKL